LERYAKNPELAADRNVCGGNAAVGPDQILAGGVAVL
jgi:hypothetical protein